MLGLPPRAGTQPLPPDPLAAGTRAELLAAPGAEFVRRLLRRAGA